MLSPRFPERRSLVLELASASQKRLPLLVMTFAYADPIDLPAFEAFGSAIQEGGGQLLPVYPARLRR